MNKEATQTHLFSRQPRSALGKIAFWSSVVGTLAGLGGAIAITIGSGAPSQNIVLTTVCWLLILVLLATRFRWAPLVATLLAAYNLYLFSVEPYAIDSLANPKGPIGGYGHFIGDVIALALGILVFGGSLGAAIENFRQGERKAPRWIPLVLSTVTAGMVVGALFIGALAQPPVAQGTTLTNGVPTVHMGASSFLQSSVTITKGSKLMLVADNHSFHILFNGSWENNVVKPASESGAPTVNDVRVNGDSIEVGPFATAGTYHIYCSVHQGMNLTVIVS